MILRLPCRNVTRAAAFYRDLFGRDDFGPVRLVFVQGEPSTAGPIVYIRVADVDAAARRAEALGGKRLMRPRVEEWGRCAEVMDCEGNLVGLTEAPSSAS